jgi:hypothetical protein
MDYVINRDVAKKVLKTVDKGLSKGLGNPVPGGMCVEAAVCYAMGMPHGDEPVCVGSAFRSYKICINDANWSSPEARAKGMRRVAIAQLGSDKLNQLEAAKELTLQVTKQLLPIALRAAAKMNQSHADALEVAAVDCESLVGFGGVTVAAYAAADAAADVAAYAAAYAAADVAAYAAADAAADVAAYAAARAARAAYAAANAARAAYAAADAAYAGQDEILSKAAEIAVQVLIKMGAEGCDWLDLTE